MRVEVVGRLEDLDGAASGGAALAVIDVLRATTSVAAALGAGAEAVWPCAGEEEARALAATLAARGRRVVLAGERDALPVEGFDLGNSPVALARAGLEGADVVLMTTNGTRALARLAAGGASPAAAALVNAGAVARYLASTGAPEVVLVCAGTQGAFALEDWVGAGAVVDALAALLAERLAAGEAALAARDCFRARRGDLLAALLAGRHGLRLAALGFEEDVRWAAVMDALDVVPVLEGGALRRWQGA